jgi:hypothetical protein
MNEDFCIETINLLSAAKHKPDKEGCIALDAKIRNLKSSGIWDKLDCLSMLHPFLCCEHDANINWINPFNLTQK